ncbi:MAG: ATP synthase F0 subunit B [Nitrospirae bacterium GWF2_44_13]|nr:MAG: ATP synthase F0 subunit B [Nitrospirae bacterium GWF2_44_13]OGW35323.1 MAG: ATP synthase F0 subunit B [Nitrospirae bacterium GWD2_44_7]OGW63786.1 MAG: ATP synthase F0 subunit B [Nitrospirae bacterium RIFOXYA2_FULL_44_9]
MKTTIQDTRYRIQDKKNHASCIVHHASFVLVVICFLLSASFTFASGGGEEGSAGAIAKDYLWKIINFGILFFVLYKFGKKPLQSFLKQRTELIEKTLKEAQQARELAQKALAEVEERLKARDREIGEIVSSAKESGEKEKARLIEEGSRMKEKILEQARTNIAYEVKRAKETIMEEASAIAIELAEKKLKEKLTEEEQLKLLEESLAKIEGKN